MASINSNSLITQWQIRERVVSLSYNESQGNFEFINSGSKPKTVESRYGPVYSKELVYMFHRTIGMNLAESPDYKVQAGHFFPKLCLNVDQEPNIKVALFGYLEGLGDLKGLRWGVYQKRFKPENLSFEVKIDDAVAREFIRAALVTKRPEHYSVTLIRYGDGRIQQIYLQCLSLLDKNIVLTEDEWAATLISSQYSTGRYCRGKFGHAMLACEGVENGKPFLKYIHFTNYTGDNLPPLKWNESRILIEEREKTNAKYKGPTWIRTRALVQNMLDYAQRLAGKPLKCSLERIFFKKPVQAFTSSQTQFLTSMVMYEEQLPILLEKLTKTKLSMNCLQCIYTIAIRGGIIFQATKPHGSPIKKIDQLNSSESFVIPKEFDVKLLGKSLPSQHKDLSKHLISDRVVLTPPDCHPDECLKWARQMLIEHVDKVGKQKLMFTPQIQATLEWMQEYMQNSAVTQCIPNQ